MSDRETFKNIIDSYPDHSSYICFAKLIKGKKWTHDKIRRFFNELVNPEDYAKEDKQFLINSLTEYSNE